MHVYSRLLIEDGAIQFLVEPDIPSMHALLVLPSGRRVRMHCVHPKPPSPTENPGSSERDAELIAVAKSVADSESGAPVIGDGDLNDVAWSATTRLFRKISGLLDPRVGRGMYNTFHASYPFLRWPLDHLFHSDHFAVVNLARLPAFGSDHFPILVEIAFVRISTGSRKA
ncbi:MAG: endonuclease/exonuclease/phosphatase family protein [Burkholderiales bacterium]